MFISRNNAQSHDNFEFYRHLIFVAQELDLHLEQQTVLAMWEFLKICLSGLQHSNNSLFQIAGRIGSAGISSRLARSPTDISQKKRHLRGDEHVTLSANRSAHESDEHSTEQLYIEYFLIAPIKVNISFIMTPQALSSGSMQRYRYGSGSSNVNMTGAPSALSLFLWQVVEVILDLTSSVSDAPIKLNCIKVENMFQTKSEVISRLQEHYFNAALGQLYKILGSLELVGNPYALVSSLGNGVFDFFYEPTRALVTNPTELSKIGRGVVKGTLSLVGNTTDGMLGTATTISKSVGRGLAALAMDEDFLRNREQLAKQPSGISGILARPVLDVGNGLYCAIFGLVRVPYKRAEKHGPIGVVTGTIQGVGGLSAKVVVGVLDAVTHLGEACRYVAKAATQQANPSAHRSRLVCLFGPDGRLLPYSYDIALGTYEICKTTPMSGRGLSLRIHTTVSFDDISTEHQCGCLPPFKKTEESALFANGGAAGTAGGLPRKNSFQSDGTASKVDGGSEEDSRECVVHAAVLTKQNGTYHVVVISTFRVVIIECKRVLREMISTALWQCKLNQLRSCDIERSGGGTKIALKFQSFDDHSNHRKANLVFKETGSGTTDDTEVLQRIYNCIHAVRTDFSRLLPAEIVGEKFAENDNGAVIVGPWEFVREEKATEPSDGSSTPAASRHESRRLSRVFGRSTPSYRREELEVSQWVIQPEVCEWEGLVKGLTSNHGIDGSDTHQQPTWLREETFASIRAHDKVPEVMELSRVKSTDNITVANMKTQLQDRLITVSEFLEMVERDAQYGDGIRGSNSAGDRSEAGKESKYSISEKLNLHRLEFLIPDAKSLFSSGSGRSKQKSLPSVSPSQSPTQFIESAPTSTFKHMGLHIFRSKTDRRAMFDEHQNSTTTTAGRLSSSDRRGILRKAVSVPILHTVPSGEDAESNQSVDANHLIQQSQFLLEAGTDNGSDVSHTVPRDEAVSRATASAEPQPRCVAVLFVTAQQ